MTIDLNARRDKVFEIIVNSYIDTAEPVGSRTISKISGLGLSAASIRNVMADLEEVGYLSHPHTSAGRVPTDRGYRYYVDSLIEPQELADDQKLRIRRELQKARSIEALAVSLSKLISEMTDNTALVYIKNLKRVSFLNHLIEELMAEHNKLMELIEEDSELFIEGTYRMFDKPEFHSSVRIKSMLQAFEDKIDFLNYFFRDSNQNSVHVYIGSEIVSDQLEDVSLVSKDCFYHNSPIGGVAVVGPTRMNYSQVMPIVDYVADLLSEAVKGF